MTKFKLIINYIFFFPAQFLSRTVAIYQFHLVQHYSFITFKLTKGKDFLIGESTFCNMEGGQRTLVRDVDSRALGMHVSRNTDEHFFFFTINIK